MNYKSIWNKFINKINEIYEIKDEDNLPPLEEPEYYTAKYRSDTSYNVELSQKLKKFEFMYSAVAIFMVIVMVGLLITTTLSLPDFGSTEKPSINEVYKRYVMDGPRETGAPNMVAGMILDYRAFDTLGEAVMLFTGVMSVVMLLYRPERRKGKNRTWSYSLRPMVLQESIKILLPFLLIFGIYLVFSGHLSPGGGFSGGAIIGAGLSLYAATFGIAKTREFFNYKIYTLLSTVALGFYGIIKGIAFFFGGNHIPFNIPLGKLGNIFSAGLILPLNICVGIVVACTIYGIYSLFLEGDI